MSVFFSIFNEIKIYIATLSNKMLILKMEWEVPSHSKIYCRSAVISTRGQSDKKPQHTHYDKALLKTQTEE